MNREVWLLEDGEYSDYHIVGIFSSEAAGREAATYLRVPSAPRRCRIDGDLDRLRDGLRCFFVSMDRNGNDGYATDKTNRLDYVTGTPRATGRRSVEVYVNEWDYRSQTYTQCGITGYIWAKTKEQATKALNEYRREAVAARLFKNRGGRQMRRSLPEPIEEGVKCR